MKLLLLFLSTCFFLCHSAQNVDRVLNSIPKTSFSCEGKGNGYFADIEAGCQSYHLCDDGGRQYTYLCPNQTLFNQRMLICDHWYQVECSISAEFYNKNDLIGNLDLHFLSEEESNRPKKKVGETGALQGHLAASSIVASQVGGFRVGPAKLAVREEFEPTPGFKPTPRTSTAGKTEVPSQSTERKTTQKAVQSTTVQPTDLVTDTTFAVETTTASLPVELHTNGEQLTTIVQEERIKLSKLLSPNKTLKNKGKVQTVVENIFESEENSESESDESSSEAPKSLFDTEPHAQPTPGTLEHEIVSIANAYANDQLTTLGFTAEETAHDHDNAHDHTHDEFLPLFDMRRMFFIPVDDHTMPPEKDVTNVKVNTITDEKPSMKFNEKKFFIKSGRTLDPNPQCPHCHPHFLQPGQCIPCVIIR